MSREFGKIGQNRYGTTGTGYLFHEEFLRELQGLKGVHAYSEMADNDATVGGILFAIEMLMRQCDFHIEPAGDTQKDKECAEFVESCMHDMERTWTDTLSEILSFLTYGWSYHEIVYKRRVGNTNSPITKSKHHDGLIGWRKLPIRSQDSFFSWEYKDGTDDLIGMTQMPAPTFERITIPIEKSLHFRTRSRKDNPEGRSILRTAYRAYYFKKRIEEIEGYGIERDLAGFPVLYAPADMDIWADDPDMKNALAMAEMLVSSVRRDAREGLVLPGGENGWKFELVTSGSRRQFDTNAIIDRYDKRIAMSVLADFIMMGQQQVGSFALADSKTRIFALAVGTYLDVICEVFNIQAIPRLININGDHFKGITDYPKMVHGDIDEVDVQQFTTAITGLVGNGIIVPDESIEDEVRRILHLPERVDTGDAEQNQAENPIGQNAELNAEESKSIYKIVSVVEKYQNGSLTRNMAAQLLGSIGLDDESVNFYLKEAEEGRSAEQDNEDARDAKKAEDAKKSLGRVG